MQRTQIISMELDVPENYYMLDFLRVYESNEKLVAIFTLVPLPAYGIFSPNNKARVEFEVPQSGFFAKPVEYLFLAESEEINQIAQENQKKCKFTIIDELPNFKNTNMTKIFEGEGTLESDFGGPRAVELLLGRYPY